MFKIQMSQTKKIWNFEIGIFDSIENRFQIPSPPLRKVGVRGDYRFSLFVPACGRQG
jgi:hypothetical protein